MFLQESGIVPTEQEFFTKVTPQIFCKSDINNKPYATASGVLIKTQTSYFLITANHVFKNRTISAFAVHTNIHGFIPLSGTIRFLKIENSYDNIDIALIKFEQSTSDKIMSEFIFLDYRLILQSHNFSNEEAHFIFGYPAHQTIISKSKIDTKPFFLITQVKKFKQYKKLRLNPEDNVLLSFHARKQAKIDSDIFAHGPKYLQGLSGGGIWVLRSNSEKKIKAYCLVGIMIEENKNMGMIIGTKTNCILNILISF